MAAQENDPVARFEEDMRSAVEKLQSALPLITVDLLDSRHILIDKYDSVKIQVTHDGEPVEMGRLRNIIDNSSKLAGDIYKCVDDDNTLFRNNEQKRVLKSSALIRDSLAQVADLLRGKNLDDTPKVKISKAKRELQRVESNIVQARAVSGDQVKHGNATISLDALLAVIKSVKQILEEVDAIA